MEKVKTLIGKNLALFGRANGLTRSDLEKLVGVYVKILLANAHPESRIKTIFGIMDEFNNNKQMADRASCKAGCSHCCHQPIMVSEEEVEYILSQPRYQGIVDFKTLAEQASWEKEDYYKNENRSKTGCVFLSDKGYCQIYTHRPAACRSYFVASHPTFCRLEYQHKHRQFELMINMQAEILLSALWSISKGSIETLAKKLFKKEKG